MATRAKFRVWTVKPQMVGDKVDYVDVFLGAVTGDTPENHEFWKATPAGQITMAISNPAAFEVFRAGQEFYIDFTPA